MLLSVDRSVFGLGFWGRLLLAQSHYRTVPLEGSVRSMSMLCKRHPKSSTPMRDRALVQDLIRDNGVLACKFLIHKPISFAA